VTSNDIIYNILIQLVYITREYYYIIFILFIYILHPINYELKSITTIYLLHDIYLT